MKAGEEGMYIITWFMSVYIIFIDILIVSSHSHGTGDFVYFILKNWGLVGYLYLICLINYI